MRPEGKFVVQVDIKCDDMGRALLHAKKILESNPDNIGARIYNGEKLLLEENRQAEPLSSFILAAEYDEKYPRSKDGPNTYSGYHDIFPTATTKE